MPSRRGYVKKFLIARIALSPTVSKVAHCGM
jgi:hypothetical protein